MILDRLSIVRNKNDDENPHGYSGIICHQSLVDALYHKFFVSYSSENHLRAELENDINGALIQAMEAEESPQHGLMNDINQAVETLKSKEDKKP